ncbi:hypothetical protein V8C44DRAFT_318499 [Trichoderma aethiopicum]
MFTFSYIRTIWCGIATLQSGGRACSNKVAAKLRLKPHSHKRRPINIGTGSQTACVMDFATQNNVSSHPTAPLLAYSGFDHKDLLSSVTQR